MGFLSDREILDAISTMKGEPMQEVLSKICFISLNIRLWQGKKALKASDLAGNGIDVSKLPPGSLASLGSKKTIDSKETCWGVSLKREAISICSKYGVKFADAGYVIPEDKVDEVCVELQRVKSNFNVLKGDFLKEYMNKVEEWIASNPVEWRTAIRNSVDSESNVEAALGFNFSSFRISPSAASSNGLQEEVDGLFGQLCREVRQAAKTSLDTSFIGKTTVGQRALRPLKHIRTKLQGMVFLDPVAIGDALTRIDTCLQFVGKQIDIEGMYLTNLVGTVSQMTTFGLPSIVEPVVPVEEVEEAEPIPEAAPVNIWDF